MKEQYRQHIASKIADLSIDEKHQQEKRINAEFLDLVTKRNSQVVLLYNALLDEVDMRSSIIACLEQGRTVLLPKVIDETRMELYHVSSLEDCIIGAYGINEPNHIRCQIRSGGVIDIGAIPGRVFDRDGGRIGRGKGYYDRLLMKYPKMMKVGVGFKEQIVAKIQMEEWDVRMDKAVVGTYK